MSGNRLHRKEKEDYGDNYQQHLFEQYKLYVEGAEKISDRREGANKYFIAINAAIFTALIISFRIGGIEDIAYIHIPLSFLGIIICAVFFVLLRSYRQLNAGKFKVIHKMEESLPLGPYDFEWKILGKGKRKDIYFPFSRVERLVPATFGMVYSVYFVLLVIKLFCCGA